MTFYELYKTLDARFPKELSCEWDNDGIMCADNLDETVKKVLVSLDVTDKTVEYAVVNGFDTIVSHHPLVFKGQKELNTLNFTQKKLISLIKSDIRVMSFHTRLDAACGGVNDVLARVLGFENLEIDSLDPIGRIASLKKPIEVANFAKIIKEKLDAPVVSYVGERQVKRAYITGGDGKDMIPRAVACGADTLITGSVSYNSMIDADEMGINVIEAGHFYTENPVCKMLSEFIRGIDGSICVEIFNSNKIKNI